MVIVNTVISPKEVLNDFVYKQKIKNQCHKENFNKPIKKY